MREIGNRIGVHASTVSRELGGNAVPGTGQDLPGRADRAAWERQRRPKPSKLSLDPQLRQEVQAMLDRRYSPEQAAGRLKTRHPGDASRQVSHEMIYQSLYVYPRGELRRELRACLRSGRAVRRPRGRREARGQIIGAVPIGDRPAEVAGRLVPGHHEGDLILGSRASNSAVGTIVERTTGYLPCCTCRTAATPTPSPTPSSADDRTCRPGSPRRSPGTAVKELGPPPARHRRRRPHRLLAPTPTPPGNAAGNENTNGLLRDIPPAKGTDAQPAHRRRPAPACRGFIPAAGNASV